VLVLTALGYSLYAAMTDSGLYRGLTERQTAWFGGHYPMLTVLVMFLAGLTAVGLITAISSRLAGPDPRGSATPVDGRAGMVLILIAGLVLLTGAVGLGWVAADVSSRPVIYAPFDLGKHDVPHGTHVELTGVEQVRLGVAVTQGTTTTQFTPFTAPDWAPDQPVTYFLKNGGASPTPIPAAFGARPVPVATVSRRGALIDDGLPGVARAAFESHGLKLAGAVFVIDPAAGAAISRLVIGAGLCGALALVCLIAFFVLRAQPRARAVRR
jgi:hypothetical protein